jgi:hypothetical protein
LIAVDINHTIGATDAVLTTRKGEIFVLREARERLV